MRRVRTILLVTPVLMLAAAVWAADPNAAMVYARGTAWVNGAAVPKSTAIFPGDLVQTRSDSIANIHAQGSSVVVQADSLVKLQANAIELEHGAVSVGTSKSLAARIGEVTVTPAASGQWTEFQVADVDGNVRIVARAGDLTITDQEGSTTLPAGQETMRDETHSQDRRRPGSPVPSARGSVLDSPAAIYGGTAIVGGVTAWVLLRDHDSASPDRPDCPLRSCGYSRLR